MNYDPYTVALLNVAEWWTGCNELCPYMGALVQRGEWQTILLPDTMFISDERYGVVDGV